MKLSHKIILGIGIALGLFLGYYSELMTTTK